MWAKELIQFTNDRISIRWGKSIDSVGIPDNVKENINTVGRTGTPGILIS